MGLERSWVTVAGEEFLNVAWHGHATGVFGVVPFKVHAGKFGTLQVLSDVVVIIEDVAEVKGVVFSNVLNAVFIDNEGKYDRSPLVNPEARCGGSLVLSGFVEACGEELVGKISRLGKDADTSTNLEIDPAIAGFVGEVIFMEKFIKNIG